jgi:hypothetical protein
MTTNKPPPDPQRLKRALDAMNRVNEGLAESKAYGERLVPPTNLPQQFLNQLMMAAVLDGNYHTLETLLDNGADPRWLRDTALLRAAGLGRTDMVRLPHARGCDVHASDDMAIRLAEGYPDTVAYLRECGCEPDKPYRPGPPQS